MRQTPPIPADQARLCISRDSPSPRVHRRWRRQLTGQSFNPFNALGLCAQLLVKDDDLELWQAIFKLGL
jgi:hypothetical protein